jgi:hypothetical protein
MLQSLRKKTPEKNTINEASRVGTTPMEASVKAGVRPVTSPPVTAPPTGASVPPPPMQCDVHEKFCPDQTADVYDN